MSSCLPIPMSRPRLYNSDLPFLERHWLSAARVICVYISAIDLLNYPTLSTLFRVGFWTLKVSSDHTIPFLGKVLPECRVSWRTDQPLPLCLPPTLFPRRLLDFKSHFHFLWDTGDAARLSGLLYVASRLRWKTDDLCLYPTQPGFVSDHTLCC